MNAETGRDKVKKICDLLKKETLEPAKQEAESLVENGRKEAERILADAEKKAAALVEEAKREIEKKENVATSTLKQAYQQTLESLRQSITEKLFQPELQKFVQKGLDSKDTAAELIRVIVQSIEKEGLTGPLLVKVSKQVKPEEINAALGAEILQKLEEQSVVLSDIGGGVEVKIVDKKVTIDLSDKALEALLAEHLHMSFRQMFFSRDV